WRKNDGLRMIAAFVSLAAGILVHYSAGIYVVFLTVHYLVWLFWRRPRKWREFATIGTTCTLLLASWFAWSVAVYGKATFLSNTTVTSTQKYEGSNVAKFTANLFDSIVPALARDPSLLNKFDQPNTIGRLRDAVFLFYQPNAVFAMGLIGVPEVLLLWFLLLLYKFWRRWHERGIWYA